MSKKFDADEAIQAYVEKKINAALKEERKRVANAVKGLPMLMNGSKKEAMALMKNIKAAIAPIVQ